MVGKVEPIADDGAGPHAVELADRVRHGFDELTTVLNADGAEEGGKLFGGLASFIAKANGKHEKPDDPVAFSWWIAEVLPLGEERYKLLDTESVEKRLELLEGYLSAVKQHLTVKGLPPAGTDVN